MRFYIGLKPDYLAPDMFYRSKQKGKFKDKLAF